ncbi:MULTISPECIES: RHS repeat-associated core domain-containing protein [Flavobacterium]|uniref:RHS repeat domain-containing protein n=1 Tax=Flavobacterium TaxID=237 RepID=UPI00293ED8E1|nr:MULTISPECIES: RHS repeat-associated core domain-containing protein [Flavobacterium]
MKIVVGTNTISYIYNATGQKVSKIVNEATTITQTNYLAGGFQYKNNVLQFFPHAEGYVKHEANNYSYVFNYTDHLGNVRVSYSDIDKNGSLGDELQYYCKPRVPSNCIEYFTSSILEENHYYPFGLKHSGYNINNSQPNYAYKYNGKELQSELGLDLYDYGARNYDPALGRWMNIDPLAENSRRWTPYNYAYNNPMYFDDPDGMQADHDYKYGTDGQITLAKKTEDKTDRLIAENGDVIADNIDQRILKDNINISENGLLIDGLDKNEDVDLNARVGDLMTKVSLYEQKEISWGFFGENKGNGAQIVVYSYKDNNYNTSEAVPSTFGSDYSLDYGNHTHTDLLNGGGSSTPSRDDMENANARKGNFVWGRKGVSQYNENGKIIQPNGSDLIRDYRKDRMKSVYDMNYIKKTLKWKKEFTSSK